MASKQLMRDCHYLTNVALKIGFIKQPEKCEGCGSRYEYLEKHHQSYKHPLKITWLCVSCHRKKHATRKLPKHPTNISELRNIREKNGYTLRDVARITGISRQGIKLIEDGKTHKPKENTIKKLAKVYGLKIKDVKNMFPERMVWVNRIKKTKKNVIAKVKNIKIKLIEINETHGWLAEKVSISVREIYMILRGNPLTMDLSRKIANEFKPDKWEDFFVLIDDL